MKSISRFKNILKGVICAVTLLMAATSHAGKATYTYDAYDRLDQLSYQDGPAFKYSYNESGSTVSKKLDGNRLRIYIFPDSSGNGEGSVSVSSNDATCGTDCYIYDAPTFVTLSTVPANSGFAFGYWSDPACGNSSTCDVYVDSIKLIKAHFTLVENTLRNYTANVTFNSQGAVSPDTPQIVQYGERINYSLTPFEPFQIASASGCNGTLNRGANTYEAGPIDESCTIDIAFGPLLNISKDGSGTGIVQDTSGAISCGDNCSAAFRHGTTVYFEAFPGSESIFSGWSSSGCSGTGNCNFTVLNPETVKATFTDMRPAAPSDLTAQVVSAKEVTLNWTQNSDDEDGFRIERKIGVLDTYTEVGTVGADETTFNDVGLIVGQSYYYRVAAYNGYGSSPYSNETSIVTYTLPMGNALDFDGVDDVVVVGNEASFDFYSTTPFTLEALVRVEEKGSGHHIIMAKQEAALDNISGSGYYLSVNEFEAGNGRLTFTMHGAAGYSEVYGTKDLIDGQWHHVAVVYSGSNFINGVSLYIDGVAELLTVDTDTLNGSSILNDAPLTVGTITNNPANIAFNGLIDEVRVWNVARTAQELFDNINVDLNGIGSGLVAEWRFEEGTGQLTLDGSLNDNDGQLGDTSGEDGNDPVWVFTGQEYTITVNVTGGIGGSLNPAGDVTVYSGGRETFEILPDRRYKVKDVFINTSSIGAVYSYEFTDVTSNQGIEVEFYEVLPSGYALDFTRSESDVVFTENESNFDFWAGTPFTMEAWIKPDSSTWFMIGGSYYGGIWSKGYQYFLYTDPVSQVVRISNSVVGSTNVFDGYWHHVALVYDGVGTGTLYVDGLKDAEGAFGPSFNNNDPFIIGGWQNGSTPLYFDGLISGARVWSVVRPSEEIYAGMDGQFGPGEAGLISNWPMNEGQGQVAGDMTGRSLGYLGTNGNVETRDPAWYDAWGVSKKQYIITATAGPNGTITPSNKVNYVEEGGSAAFTITPSQNLRIQDVLVDGTSVGAVPSYTFTNVTTNRSIEAYFSSPIEELPTTNALQFDGVDDVVIFENASGFNLYSAMPFTLEAWVKADEKVTGNHIVIAKQDTTIGTRGYYLMINDEENDQFSFFMMADSTHYLHVDGGVDVIDGQWHHVAVTYDGNGGSGIKLYVDGAEDPLTTVVFDNIGTNSMDNNVPLTIGTRNNNTSDVAFDGLIDEVRFWSDVRTAQEVSDNMNILVQGNEAGLAGNWRMDEGNGQIAWDNAGNSNGRLGDTNAVDGNDPVWVDFTGSFGLQLVVMTNISSGGTMYPDYPLMVDTGSVITYAIIPDAGYDIESVTGCGGILVTDNSFVTDAITADCTVTASFTDLAHTVTATAGAGGTITPAQATVVYGNATSFLIEPDIGNHLLSVESDCGGGLVGNTYITGPVTAECQLSASFGNNLNVNTVPQDGGTVASLPAGIDCGINCSAAFTHGSSVSLTAVPGTGSVFTGWNGGGCSGTGNCTVTLNADTTVTASFNYTDQLVRIGGTTPIYFTSIQAAYEHAHTEGMSAVTIQMKMTGLTEIVNLNWPISVTLEGGYNSDYSSVAGVTTLYGDITLNNGTLTIENIEISP